jgi:hypothetical protein
MDADNSQSGSYPHPNDYGSKFGFATCLVLFEFKLCFAVHDTVYEYEFIIFSGLRLHLVLF